MGCDMIQEGVVDSHDPRLGFAQGLVLGKQLQMNWQVRLLLLPRGDEVL